MKRKGHIYEKMCDPAVIREAIIEASKGKRHRHDVKRTLADIDGHIAVIKKMLEEHDFTPSPYFVTERYDPHSKKTRIIQRPKFFPDQVVHWVIVIIIKDIMMRGMYYWNCGSVPGRGTKHGQRAVRRWMNKDRKNTKYALKLDIRKYYDTIPHDRLMALMRSKIKDERALWLIQKVVDTVDTGVPIGNYTSQWFANFYLEKLDHYIKETLGVKYYVRYIDDLVLFGRNKKELHRKRKLLFDFIETELGLSVKDNWQLFPVKARGVDFLGYVFFHTHTTMRGRNFLAFARQCRKVKKRIDAGKAIPYKTASGLLSRAGQLRHCDSYLIRHKYYAPIKENQLKEVVRIESKRRLQAERLRVRGTQ